MKEQDDLIIKQQEILDQIFETGVVVREIELIKDKLYAKVSTLCSEDQLLLEKAIPTSDSGTWYALHKYSRDLLKYTLKSYGKETFETPERAEIVLKTLASALLDRLVKEQSALEKELRQALSLGVTEKHFFAPDGTEDGSEPLQGELTSENQEA